MLYVGEVNWLSFMDDVGSPVYMAHFPCNHVGQASQHLRIPPELRYQVYALPLLSGQLEGAVEGEVEF